MFYTLPSLLLFFRFAILATKIKPFLSISVIFFKIFIIIFETSKALKFLPTSSIFSLTFSDVRPF